LGERELYNDGSIAGYELLPPGTQANANRPVDAYGRRIDRVEFHPAGTG